MAKITTPVNGFTGQVIDVAFVDGVGETDDEGALAYFARHGYGIEIEAPPQAPEIPDGNPAESWTKAQLVAWGQREDVALPNGSKAEILAAALEAVAAKTAQV